MFKKLYWFLFVYDLNTLEVKPLANSPLSTKQNFFKDIAILTLLSYLLFSFNTCIPLFTDLLAHTFWEKEHLAIEHKLHGKNHTGLEIVKISNETAKEKATGNSKINTKDCNHILAFTIKICTTITITETSIYSFYQRQYSAQPINKDYPPPRA